MGKEKRSKPKPAADDSGVPNILCERMRVPTSAESRLLNKTQHLFGDLAAKMGLCTKWFMSLISAWHAGSAALTVTPQVTEESLSGKAERWVDKTRGA